MKSSARLLRFALAILVCAGLSGCLPPGQSQLDEEKEPHFIEGKRAVNSMDYKGAIDEFEKAVEANPHNASAHFELGWLYEEKEPDSAAAIYHYEQFLKYRPGADTSDAVKQRIMNCKQDLAKAVLPLPTTPGVQRDLEQLIQENKQLKVEVDQWRASAAQQRTNQTSPPPPVFSQGGQSGQASPTPTNSAPPSGGDSRIAIRTTATRTYTVQSGDTLASISRKYNVKLDSLTAANPGVDARRLHVGQTVKIP